ncbi:DNA mismatch repair protein MutS [Peptoniphilus sp. MSJ-1]|uniref:DNA mismatch repair protein MutS n=1 Tax=Peptoniphilus ovalis TaxID=2841503 RepID=A0ABS6FDU6_9FIRM|nr:DNA mismatch repair protein MutS [Peptoniphilus ovalis]MBU5668347.1 DNA mismatch repair protein MutS [Peptoniphilus ovalis]
MNLLNKDILTIIFLITIFLFIIFAYFIYENKKREKIIKREIDENFGNIHSNEIKFKFNGIYEKLGGNLSDITYDDLNFNEIISKMNHFRSKLGIEYFYYKIRSLVLDKEDLLKIQNNRMKYKTNTSEMKKMQFYLSNIGFFKEDVIELIDEDIEVKRELDILSKVFSFSIIYILITFIFFKALGIVFAMTFLAINTYIYKKFNKETLGKLGALIKLKTIIFTSEKIANKNFNIFEEERKEILSILDKIKPLRKALKSFKYLSGNLEMDFAETYRNIIFLTEARKFTKSAKYLKSYREEIFRLYYLVGKIDCEIGVTSISLAYDTRDASFENGIYGRKLYNPLIKDAVPNDLNMDKSILLTGSNASGKSTYLRTCGINAVFALSFGIFFGEEFNIKPMIVTSAIDISDSIMKNLSYFMAEAKAIEKMIDDDKEKFILLDEIFRGTNTVDRISAATATLKYLSKENHVIAATHDIELTELLKNEFKNMHFEEEIVDGDIKFDYLLREGPTKTRNAINILESLNYPQKIIEEAKGMSKEFENR